MLPAHVVDAAKKIRRTLENGRYKNEKHKKRFAHAFDPDDFAQLAGACGVASVMLCVVLGDMHLKHLRGTRYHAWNIFRYRGKRVIVDITATQFDDCPPCDGGVYISTTPAEFHTRAYAEERAFKHGLAMLTHMEYHEWYAHPRGGATDEEVRCWASMYEKLQRVNTQMSGTGA